MHFAADLAGRVVDFADFGEEGGDLVTAEESSRPSLQQVTQAGLDGSWGGQENSLRVKAFLQHTQYLDEKSLDIIQEDKKTTIRSGVAAEHKSGRKKLKMNRPVSRKWRKN